MLLLMLLLQLLFGGVREVEGFAAAVAVAVSAVYSHLLYTRVFVPTGNTFGADVIGTQEVSSTTRRP